MLQLISDGFQPHVYRHFRDFQEGRDAKMKQHGEAADGKAALAAYADYFDDLANRVTVEGNLERLASRGCKVVVAVGFALEDAHLTRRWKDLRHELATLRVAFPPADLLRSRDTSGDIGTSVKTDQELSRDSLQHVAQASCKRLEQALRSLEEYAKVLGLAAPQFESLRYQVYTLEKATLLTADSQQRLANAWLYVLLDGGDSESSFEKRTREICQAGAAIVQLRDKKLADRELLVRGKLLRQITRECGTLFIMNDRPDLAVLSTADGVHVGQDELSIQDVRRVVGPDMLIGVSTHDIGQARAAVLAGASYLGCGPTFPSGTKQFEHFPGLPFLREVAAEICLPAFAIGGITLENLPQVLETGMKRVAMSGAVAAAKEPGLVVKSMLCRLDG